MRYAQKAAIVLALLAVAFSQPARAELNVSFGFFYSNLSPHGVWTVSAQYGRVWQPAVYHPGWNPYYDGHWIYTDVGWTWDSAYSWGAIPYHYGTWVLDAQLGWVWVPGYTWAPAWVEFCTGPDYIGWAPAPVGFSIGASFGFGVADAPLFVFVSAQDFLAPRVGAYAYPAARTQVLLRNARIVNGPTVQNNIVVNRGVDPAFVQRATGRALRPTPVEQVAGAAPFSHFSRTQVSVDPQRTRGGLRAAEPFPARNPLPGSELRATRASNSPQAPGGHRSRSFAQETPNQPSRRASEARPPAPGNQAAPQRVEHRNPSQPVAPPAQQVGRVGPNRRQPAAPQQKAQGGRGAQRRPGPQEQKNDKAGHGGA